MCGLSDRRGNSITSATQVGLYHVKVVLKLRADGAGMPIFAACGSSIINIVGKWSDHLEVLQCIPNGLFLFGRTLGLLEILRLELVVAFLLKGCKKRIKK